MRDKSNRSALPHAQATGRRVNLKIVLSGNGADLSLRFLTDQRAVVQGPGNGGFRNPSQPGNISDRANSSIAHVLIYATDCIINRQKHLVKRQDPYATIYLFRSLSDEEKEQKWPNLSLRLNGLSALAN